MAADGRGVAVIAAGNPYLWIAGVVVVVAAALLIVGIRGRPVPPRRVCRKCRYEVGEQAVCPECGRDLGRRRGRGARIVRRRPRRRLVWSGAGLAGALLVAGATLGVLAARGVDLNRYKPLALLLWEAQSADVRTADAAAEELCRRRFGGVMPDAETDRVLRLALRIHADELRHWPGPLSAVINEAMLAGRMSAAEIQSYFEHVARPQLVLPQGPPPRAGSPLTLSLDHRWRAGTIDPARGGVAALWVTVEPAPPAIPAFDRPLILLPQRPDTAHGALRTDIPEGVDRYEARALVRYELNLDEQGWGGDHPLARIAAENPGLGAFQREVALAFDVAPPPMVEIILDTSAETRAQMLEAIEPRLSRSGDTVLILFERRAIPARLHARVSIQDPQSGEERETAAPLTADSEIGLYGIAADATGLTADVVHLIIRPSPAGLRHSLVERRTDASVTMFGGELVIRDVPIQLQAAPAEDSAGQGARRGRRR